MESGLPQDSRATLALTGARLDAVELILGRLAGPIDGYCLPGKRPPHWPEDSTLTVSLELAARAAASGSLVLTDPDGTPIASVEVTAIHGGSVAGTLTALQPAEHPPARDIRFSLANRTAAVIAVFNAPPLGHQIAQAIETAAGQPLLFLAVGWNSAAGDPRLSPVIDELRMCAAEVPGSLARFLPLAELSPGLSSGLTSGLSAASGPEAALALALGSQPSRTVLDFCNWYSQPTPLPGEQGAVVLLTGLSGSGKSTVARALAERLARDGLRPVLLDGDDVRRVLSPTLGFSVRDREENVRRIGWVAARIASAGGIALCAPIAPFAHSRLELREFTEPESRFILVHVATPLEVCEARDRKGLYALARAGTLVDFTGIDSPYETPTDADVVIDTSGQSVEQCVDAILAVLLTNGAAQTPAEGLPTPS